MGNVVFTVIVRKTNAIIFFKKYKRNKREKKEVKVSREETDINLLSRDFSYMRDQQNQAREQEQEQQ